jgi:hypothetical protein
MAYYPTHQGTTKHSREQHMKLADIKPTADSLFGNIQENILNEKRKLTLNELAIVSDIENRDRMTTFEWLQVVTMYPAEMAQLSEQRDADSIAATGRTLLEQTMWDAEQEILNEQRGER